MTGIVIRSQRSSNIELLRIVAMFLIVLHHYCVNSGFVEIIDPRHLTGNTLLIQFLSFGGKVGVNIFFLISGFFMINSSMKWNKVLRLVFQIFSINVIICLFLSALGYSYDYRDYLKMIPLLFSVPASFIASYMVIYLLSPIINKSLHTLSKSEFNYLLLILITYFCLFATFLFQNTWHYVGWAFTMYCVGGYIKKYDLTQLNWHFGWISFGLLLLTWGAILILDFVAQYIESLPNTVWAFAISDANKITVFALGVSIFFYFAKLHVRYCKFINYIGGGIAFGVLLWHANNDLMRQCLWKDFLINTRYFCSDYLPLHCLLSVVGVYAVCTILELIRHYLIEEPIFSWFAKWKEKRNDNRND